MRVCHTMVRRPRCSGVASAVTRVPTGAEAMKFVLLSIVVVPAPSGRLRNVPTPPSVSANAMIAPPCSTAGRVHRSSRTVISATTRSGAAWVNSIPMSSANGSISDLIFASASILDSPSAISTLSRRPAVLDLLRLVARLPLCAPVPQAAHRQLPVRVPDAAAPTPPIPASTRLRGAARGAADRAVPGAAGSARGGAILKAPGAGLAARPTEPCGARGVQHEPVQFQEPRIAPPQGLRLAPGAVQQHDAVEMLQRRAWFGDRLPVAREQQDLAVVGERRRPG